MSREIKICNVNTLNDVNDRVRNLQRTVQKDIVNAQRIALNTASADAQRRIDRAKQEMQDRMNKNTSYINNRLQTLDTNHRLALRNLSNQVYDKMSNMNKDITVRMDRQYDSIQKEMQKMNRSICHDMNAMDINIRTDMEKMQNGIHERIDRMQQWTKENMEILSDNIHQLASEVNNHFEQQQADIATIRQDVNSLFEGLKQKHAAGKEAVSMANELIDKVKQRTNLARFAPDKWREINMRIDALNTLTDDSACIAQANEICIQTMLAEEEAVKNKLKHDALVNLAIEQLIKVLEVINTNREVRASNPVNSDEVVKIETNFWTRGEYQKIIDELEQIKKILDNPYAKDVTLDSLQNKIDRVAILEQNGNELIQAAIERAVLSENRVVVTEDIVTALIEQGYEVKLERGKEAINYMGGDQENDWREGVYAVMEKGSGEEITVIVRPDESAINNQIVFHRNDERNMTDAQYIASLERIKKEIEKSGHSLGKLQAPADGGNTQIPELCSGTSMSKKGAAQKLRERVYTQK